MKNRLFTLLTLLSLIAPSVYAADSITGSGATFPAPLYAAWAVRYGKETGIKVKYNEIGSGGGLKEIRSRTVDFGASDVPLLPNDLAKDGLIQFPAVIGGVVLAVHIPGVNTAAIHLAPETVCGIYSGEITYWDDKKIAAINQGVFLPKIKIIPVHRSDESGTTAIFTNYLNKVCPSWRAKAGEGTTIDWPAGRGAKGSVGVAQYVKNYPGAVGYIEFSNAKQQNLNCIKLKNAAGSIVEPGRESFQEAAATGMFYQGTLIPKKDFYLWLTNAQGKQAWPLTGATFIILAKDRKRANDKVARFFGWAYKKGDAHARDLLYFPLPRALKVSVEMYWQENGIAVE